MQLASKSDHKWLRKSKWHSALCIPRFTHTHTQIHAALFVINGNIIIGNVFHHTFVNSERIFKNLTFLETLYSGACPDVLIIQICLQFSSIFYSKLLCFNNIYAKFHVNHPLTPEPSCLGGRVTPSPPNPPTSTQTFIPALQRISNIKYSRAVEEKGYSHVSTQLIQPSTL